MFSLSISAVRRRSRTRAAVAVSAAALGLGALLFSAPRAEAAFSAGGQLPKLSSGRIWQVAAQPGSPSSLLAATDRGLYLSHDAGSSWSSVGALTRRAWSVGFDARNPAIAYAGTDGSGVFLSKDGGQTWQESSAGLLSLDVRCLAFGLEGVVAGTASGVFLSPDGESWHDVGLDGNSISALAVAANAPTLTIIAGADAGDLSRGYLFRSAGGGAWQALESGLPNGAVVSDLGSGPIDAAVPQRPLVAATTKGVFRSGDGGTTWTPSTGVPSGLSVTTITFSSLDPTLVYAGADAAGSTGGDLLRSTDGGVTFAQHDQGLPQNSRNVESISVAQTNPPTVVAALDPPNGGGRVYTEVDTSAPAPPQLTPEQPGATIPAVVSTPHPTPKPTPRPVATAPASQSPTGFTAFLGTAFHWPIPLVYELIFVLLIVYLFVRWRQRYYVEGPP